MKKYDLIICWKCKKARVILRKCQNGIDYVCEKCLDWVGLDGPEIGNQSKIHIGKEKHD